MKNVRFGLSTNLGVYYDPVSDQSLQSESRKLKPYTIPIEHRAGTLKVWA